MKTARPLVALSLLLGALVALAQSPGNEAHGPSQAAADVLREVAGADGAFLAAGLVKSNFDRDNLASLMTYPDDEIVVVAMKGSDIRAAFERSVALLPESNLSFLQVSGFEIAFDPKAMSGARIKNVTVGGSKLDDGREYRIAMPSSLGRGGFGYFKIWDRSKIVQTLSTTVEKALVGKKATETRPRWVAQS